MRLRSIVFDAAIAVAVTVPTQIEAWTGTFATRRQGPPWVEALAYGLAGLALAFRRRFPLGTVLVVCGVMIAEFALVGAPAGYGVAVLPVVAAYTVANREERRRALWGLAALVLLGLAWQGLDPVQLTLMQRAQGFAWISPWLIAWLLGAYLRTRRLYVEGLERRREEKAVAAVAEERNRIARELHDVIGHSVSVMTVQASAVRRLMRSDQAKERAALETVEATGREALAEMRRMVGVLRSPDGAPDLTPPPTLEQLDRLVDTFREAGLDVTVHTEGEIAPLPPGLDLTAYRLVQEGLTNALKHAHAEHVSVVLSYRPHCLALSVRDDGRGPDPAAIPGNGLLGMRERVAVYGGSLSAGPAPGGGFTLAAELPIEVPG